MRTRSFSRLGSAALLRKLDWYLAKERFVTAVVIALLAEVDARKLYLSEGYPSRKDFCIDRLRFSEDAAWKRTQAARAAQKFPRILTELAKGRLHLSGACLLAPHLLPGNADELIAAALDQTKTEIERMLVARCPKTESMPLVTPIPSSSSSTKVHVSENQAPVAARVGSREPAPGQVDVDNFRAKIAPIAAERFEIRFMVGKETHDKLRYARELSSHQDPSGDPAEVFDRALDAYIHQLEKRKFAATDRPQKKARRSNDPRHIPPHVKRVVRERDRGQCTFVGENGHRCLARKFLQYDHIDPVARGGQSTVDNIRLHCRGHNQLEAERVFGADFIKAKVRKRGPEIGTRVVSPEPMLCCES